MKIAPIIFLLAVAIVSSQRSYAEISSEDKAFVSALVARIKDAGNDSKKLADLDKEFFEERRAKLVEEVAPKRQNLTAGQKIFIVLAIWGLLVLIEYGLGAEARERAEYNRSLEQWRANVARERYSQWPPSVNNPYKNSSYGYGSWK